MSDWLTSFIDWLLKRRKILIPGSVKAHVSIKIPGSVRVSQP